MVSLASWNHSDTDVTLTVNWKKLGIDPATATITAPPINNFQDARVFKVSDKIPVSKNKGWLLIIQ